MNALSLQKKTIALTFSLLSLSGCDKINGGNEANIIKNNTPHAARHESQDYYPEIPALPLIQSTIASMAPAFENNDMAKEICALAQEKLTQAQVNDWLRSQSIDAAKIPAKGSNMSLLVNGDKTQQNVACAAYVASSVLSLVEFSDFSINVITNSPATNAKRNLKHKGSVGEGAVAESLRSRSVIDDKKLTKYLETKLTVAKANADFYTLIAMILERSPNLSTQEYSEKIQQIFTRIAPAYLQHINELYADNAVQYKVISLKDDEVDFVSSDGYHFIRNEDGVMLKYTNVIWYGGSYLMGKSYTLRTKYYSSSLLSSVMKLDGNMRDILPVNEVGTVQR